MRRLSSALSAAHFYLLTPHLPLPSASRVLLVPARFCHYPAPSSPVGEQRPLATSSGAAVSASSFASPLHAPLTSSSSSSSFAAAPLATVEPRVLAWYRANSSFDMERVVKVLEDFKIKVDVCYPPCQALSSTSNPPSAAASAAGAPSASSRVVTDAKQVELIGFTVASARSGVVAGTVQPRTTYMVFADGGLVAWNADWEELVWMRSFLSADSAAQSGADRPPNASSPQSSSSFSGGGGGYATAVSALPSSATVAAAATTSKQLLAFDSMRYTLYDTLPMDQRPTAAVDDYDTPLHHPSTAASYIDAARDRIVLKEDSVLLKVPYSYALVQSVKLEALHYAMEPIALNVKRWQQRLSVDGRLVVSLSSLRKAKAQLLTLTENVYFEQEATPKLFWHAEYGALRASYREVSTHLEMEDRIGGLKQQLEAVDETLSYLHQEVHAAMNEWLTWVIIVLIAAELLVASGVVERLVFGSMRRHGHRHAEPSEASTSSSSSTAHQPQLQ